MDRSESHISDSEVQLVHVEPIHDVEIETVSYDQMKDYQSTDDGLDDFDGNICL